MMMWKKSPELPRGSSCSGRAVADRGRTNEPVTDCDFRLTTGRGVFTLDILRPSLSQIRADQARWVAAFAVEGLRQTLDTFLRATSEHSHQVRLTAGEHVAIEAGDCVFERHAGRGVDLLGL